MNVWVSTHRPRTERERDGQAANAPEPDPALSARWAPEPAWPGKIGMVHGRPGDECPECGGPLMWEPGRTVVFCGQCKTVSLPAAVAEHYARQERRSAEVATRAAPDAAAVRTARVRLAALKTRTADQVAGWLDVLDPDDLSGPIQRLALDYRAEVSAWLPEIKNAASEGELAEIVAEVAAVVQRAESSGVLEEIQRHREAVERQAELAKRQAELAAQAEWEAEQERQEQDRRRRAEIAASAQRRAIAPPAARRTAPSSSPNGYVEAAVRLAKMMEDRRQGKEQAAARLASVGACQYQHRKPVVAGRRYYISTTDWSGTITGYEYPDAPAVLACQNHFAMADAWIDEQASSLAGQGASVHGAYSELT